VDWHQRRASPVAGGKLERLPVTDPLASASVLALMEDREGNIWLELRPAGCTFARSAFPHRWRTGRAFFRRNDHSC